MRELALFAGAGGGILGGKLLGWQTVCAVEINSYCASILCRRQDEGILAPFPIWDDVTTFDGRPWRGVVDVISGGFPCQDISAAGRGAGITGERSGLWSEMARIIGEIRPRFVFVENSPMLVSRGLGRVLADLATLGFDAKWGIIGAHHTGAPHKRDRIWVLAGNTDRVNEPKIRRFCGRKITHASGICSEMAYASKLRPQKQRPKLETTRLERIGENLAHTISEQLRTDGSGQAAGTQRENQEPRHQRQRIRSDASECGTDRRAQDLGNTKNERLQELRTSGQQEPSLYDRETISLRSSEGGRSTYWTSEPRLDRVAHGVAHRVDRLKAIGNGQVPAVVELAWRTLRDS